VTGTPLPHPLLTRIYRLEADPGLTGGIFTGRALTGRLLPGASADRDKPMADGSAGCALRYTLQTREGDLLHVRSRGVTAGDDTFRTATNIQTDAPSLGWLNTGVFVGVALWHDDGVIHETYLVD
jgi:hypothetical protein